jgi:hypothetical protein
VTERKQRELRDVSDELLEELQAIDQLEREKRRQSISTPEFHRLTDRVAEKSRRIFDLGTTEDAVSDRLDQPLDVSTEDIPARRSRS